MFFSIDSGPTHTHTHTLTRTPESWLACHEIQFKLRIVIESIIAIIAIANSSAASGNTSIFAFLFVSYKLSLIEDSVFFSRVIASGIISYTQSVHYFNFFAEIKCQARKRVSFRKILRPTLYFQRGNLCVL